MKQVVIKNPVINSPFAEPQRHFRFDEQGITNQIVEQRRKSEYFIPIPKSKRQVTGQGLIDFGEGWTGDRLQENRFINDVRERVAIWRRGGYVGITPTTRRLLDYWTDPQREKRFFFCQREAMETAIYITEVADKYGDNWIKNELRRANALANPLLFRIAFKMATGAGKTVVMAMLMAWHTLNKLANPQDAKFSDAFLIVTPGLTIRDRLRVLLPNDPQNYYDQRDIVPPDGRDRLHQAKIVITNFHAFLQRTRTPASKLTQSVLRSNGQSGSGRDTDSATRRPPEAFTETPSQMVRRVTRELGNKRNLIVINDEAHHCYRRKPDDVKLTGDERVEAEQRNEEARVWVSGVEAVKEKIGVKVVYDLSATPFFLQGSGYTQVTPDGKKITEGVLFPWVVSDFSLIDAIESGIVKVPRVPIADNSGVGELPTYRDLWLRIREELPKRGRRGNKDVEDNEAPKLPAELQGALISLYGNYEKSYRQWEADPKGQTPPVMIIVCNNTTVSKLVYDWVAGWEKQLEDGRTVVVPGNLSIFSNEQNGRWQARPNTILIDSQQLESGETMSSAFKQIAATEIEQFKSDYQTRFPGRSVEKITDEDLLREVMNTVGKPGKLGERVKCVVSVSMLSEGWDCLDRETEILTPSGWAGQGQISVGDLVYSLNRDTGKLEIVPVLEYGKRTVRPDESMVRIKSQHLDIRVTEGHQFHIKYRDPRAGGALSRNMITRTGAELFQRKSAYALPLAAETANPFPGIPLTDDEIRFVAWFMTDGGFSNYRLAICQSKEFRHEIRALLKRLKLDYTERVVPPGKGSFRNAKPVHVFSIPKGTRTDSLARNGWNQYRDYLDKSVAPALHAMTRRQFLVFWEELLKGDGERQGNKSGWLWCSEKEQVDAYTHMAVVRGLAASFHERITKSGKTVYRVSIRDAQWLTSHPGDERASTISLEKPKPDEAVWCVRNQNSTLVTRRNGKIVILGNCNTVTHILGVRAFGTQLLCEQVVGRGLRRASYETETLHIDLNGKSIEVEAFPPEYAEVYGIPFSFIPSTGSARIQSRRTYTHVRALEERIQCEIQFPRVNGYRYHIAGDRIDAIFDNDSRLPLSTAETPTKTETASIIGEADAHYLTYQDERLQKVEFHLTKVTLETYFRDEEGHLKPWLFPQLLDIVRRWMRECVTYKDNTYPQMFLVEQYAHQAADRIYQAVVKAEHAKSKSAGEPALLPILRPYENVGSTRYVAFDTARPVYATDPKKCHISHVVADTESWEQKTAQSLEEMDAVRRYVKNHNLGFTIPYISYGRTKQYIPDFIAEVDLGKGDPLHLILEVSGEAREDKPLKVNTARNLWAPAVNNAGKFGRWDFLEISDPWDVQHTVSAFLDTLQKEDVYGYAH